ncbi:TraM recognition domain-containing protein [Micromonospora sp. WMMA1363]|uniref:type IV secretory system conjugative DNA transfer family protein n=1 Tax=Micromonospora sp. WMMA1363 TaxID=3053985 RepID=UPI00259CC6EA|nr:TraM recognition domain-containing protein [Micromonospora sp. WMMA1363]MDM4723316.1 TraM recognition domain-containing protein [Micromonospora sp. WMMA1363]
MAVVLGTAEGSEQRLYGQLEDSIAVVGGPRSMKTAAVIIDMVRTSPGPTVAVSTKADVLRATYLARRRRGRVWVFDPGDVVGWPTGLQWSPVAGCEDPDVAMARAEGFAAAVPRSAETRNGDFFESQARDVLRCFLHAAALDRATMEDVIKWGYRIDSPTLPAREILRTHPRAAPMWAEELEALTSGDAREGPLDSTRKTLQRLLAPFASARLLRMCCPPAGTGFDVQAFLESTDTLYVVVGDGTTVAPLVTTLVNEIMRLARRVSQRMAPPRMDPPLRVVIDEVAQCPLPNLPALMSDSGGRGVTMVIGSQGLGQTRARWGRDGAAEVFASATTRLIMGGTSEPEFLAEQSQLAGEVDVASSSTTVSERGGVSSTTVSRERPRVRPHEIRELAPGNALVLYRQAPPVISKFVPYWDTDWADEAEKSAARVADIVAGRVQESP